jgi:putative peptidoglycan lipid II flippase
VSGRGSYLVGAGILLSRISGLVRQKILAHFLGLGDEADAVTAALRIPNFLQNLFGEGALSASFIPRYARLLGEGREEEAGELAGAILSLLAVVVAVMVAVGILAAPWLVTLLVGDWSPEKRALTETLVRILFPSVGLLVISAWCLGILNSHRRFFVSYTAPVAWNIAIITAVLLAPPERRDIVIWASWGAVAGAMLQVLVQLPSVRAVAGVIRPRAWRGVEAVSQVVRTFVPAVMARGAAQIASFIDLAIAGFLPGGAVAAIANAQVLYTLPVSLFGMAVSAAELPEMARAGGDGSQVAGALRVRLDAATQRLAYYIIPSAMAFLSIGGVLAGAVYQGGAFSESDARYVWLILAGSAFGLLASTLGRLYSSAFYALHDTVTPLRFALVRIVSAAGLGAIGALLLPRWLGLPGSAGAAGLTLAGGLAGWLEFALLRRALCHRLGSFSLPLVELAKLWFAAILAAVAATAVRLPTESMGPLLQAALVIPVFSIVYLGATAWMNLPESAVITARLRRRRNRER